MDSKSLMDLNFECYVAIFSHLSLLDQLNLKRAFPEILQEVFVYIANNCYAEIHHCMLPTFWDWREFLSAAGANVKKCKLLDIKQSQVTVPKSIFLVLLIFYCKNIEKLEVVFSDAAICPIDLLAKLPKLKILSLANVDQAHWQLQQVELITIAVNTNNKYFLDVNYYQAMPNLKFICFTEFKL
ncbi:uncharacterized protein LOC108601990 isoform X2 [Drosophila busckii]|uniref:uncharacterized protein LOC108601990 isoform X2 n=1 Tax=Drosophila busckii TaxID=30019 RepID=UPI00083F392A|nr:uncharacterized protein LOC108601990 isoform X2 [Drosophila busckii]